MVRLPVHSGVGDNAGDVLLNHCCKSHILLPYKQYFLYRNIEASCCIPHDYTSFVELSMHLPHTSNPTSYQAVHGHYIIMLSSWM